MIFFSSFSWIFLFTLLASSSSTTVQGAGFGFGASFHFLRQAATSPIPRAVPRGSATPTPLLHPFNYSGHSRGICKAFFDFFEGLDLQGHRRNPKFVSLSSKAQACGVNSSRGKRSRSSISFSFSGSLSASTATIGDGGASQVGASS